MLRNTLITAVLTAAISLSVPAAQARAFSNQTGRLNPQISRTSVDARGTDRYTVTFMGGEMGRVEVNGDGSTLLDLYIYDGYGNLIRHQEGLRPWINFYPQWTGAFRIVISNRGSVENDYVMRTN